MYMALYNRLLALNFIDIIMIYKILFICTSSLLVFLHTLPVVDARETITIFDGSGQRYEDPPRLAFPEEGKRVTPRWIIIGGRRVIPGSVYRVVAESLKTGTPDKDLPLTVRASITHDDRPVAFGKTQIQPGELSHILLKIPDSSEQGAWQLRIDGREGESQFPVFKNSTDLTFSSQFLTILIQTSRPVYNVDHTVRFRVVLLTRELKPFKGPVDIFITDSRGRIMKRWLSRQTGDGVINLNFFLPRCPVLGNWTIQARARQQIQSKTILVEQYFRPRFEVFVRLPHTFKVTDDVIKGVVMANMTNWRHVYGNCSIKLQMATNASLPVPKHFQTVHEEFIQNFTGSYEFRLPMAVLADGKENLKDSIIRVYASVGAAFIGRIHHAWALARIVKEEAKVTFLGDQPLFFRPGMPITVHTHISYNDNHPFKEEDFEGSELTVTFRSTKTHVMIVNGTDLAEQEGVFFFTSTIPEEAKNLEVTARFVSGKGISSSATLLGIIHHSPRERHLQIETSTHNAVPGEFIVLHVRNNFFITHFNYLVVANDLIVYSGREYVNDLSFPSVTTFSLPAAAHMTPVTKILVWLVDQNSEVVAHSIAIPVNPLGQHKVGMQWNDHKDHTGRSAEIKMLGEPGAFFAASAVWEETHHMDAGHDLDAARVLHHMMGFHESRIQNMEEVIPHIRRAATRSRDGYGSTVRFFPTSNAGPDVPTTFNFTGVALLTDAVIYYHPSKASDAPSCHAKLFPCFTGGCYTAEERCDGVPNCSDFSDESGCPLDIDPLRGFRMHRFSRLFRFYDSTDGDWAWKDVRRIGREIQVFKIPKIPQSWVVSVFAMGKESGLGIIEKKIQVGSTRPFMLTVDCPDVARMWEQVGLTVGLFNYHLSTVGILVTLPYSPDYQSIVVEQNGIVSSYNPRKLNGTFQHLVWLAAGASFDLHIPIVFTRMGDIKVTVKGETQMQSDSQTINIEILPEGAVIEEHTSLLLDLKDRAIVHAFMDIHLDESPIIPYSLLRKYVYGTAQGHITVTGDVFGPTFPKMPFTENDMIGFDTMGAETSAFNIAANIWSLRYLKLTNQLKGNDLRKVLSGINSDFVGLLRYQYESGGFSNWVDSEESVWLTAHALKCLRVSNFQDWGRFFYIDPKILQLSITWLLQHQTEQGSFMETPHYINPLDPKVDPRSRHSWMPKYQNLSLTAHVVMALDDVLDSLKGEIHSKTILAKQKAVRFLEKSIDSLTDPYDLAVVTWALVKTDSKEKDFAFSSLNKMKRVNGDLVYWSREPISFNEIVYEDSQRPYIQPIGDDNLWNSHAVETTAYALLIYIKSEGIGIIQENIVRFLSYMRKLDGGLNSSIDSLVAMEALVEYAYRARIRDITDMHVVIEHSGNPNSTIDVALSNNPNLADSRVFELENIFGHLSITGHGSGQALVQLAYSYGVDSTDEAEVPSVPSFNFSVHAKFTGRNNSHIIITTCQSWINLDEAETSGVAIVEIHIPSGYHIMQDELIRMSKAREVRNMRWALRRKAFVKFIFHRLDIEPICFNYTLERWYPVANHSRYNLATVYSLYQPERFNMKIFEVYPLYALDICEVCGSYQCPYCPFYNGSPGVHPSVLLFVTLLVFLHLLRSSYLFIS